MLFGLEEEVGTICHQGSFKALVPLLVPFLVWVWMWLERTSPPPPTPPLKDNTRNGDADVNMRSLWQREIRWYKRKLCQSFILWWGLPVQNKHPSWKWTVLLSCGSRSSGKKGRIKELLLISFITGSIIVVCIIQNCSLKKVIYFLFIQQSFMKAYGLKFIRISIPWIWSFHF